MKPFTDATPPAVQVQALPLREGLALEITAIAALFMASAINAALPGPVTILTFGRTAHTGLRAGLAVTLGVLTADALLVGVALTMTVGAVAMTPSATVVMKWAGVAILVGLALRTFCVARKPAALAPRRDGVAGLLVGMSSPYNLVFYLAVLPQVLPRQGASMASLPVIVAAIFAGVILAQASAIGLALWCRGVAGWRSLWADYAGAAALLVIAGVAASVPAAG